MRHRTIAVALALPLALTIAGCPLEPFASYGMGGGAGSSSSGGGSPIDCIDDGACDDDNPCTLDRCIESACQHDPEPLGQSCADGDACNGDETCDGAGQCQDGAPVSVDDGDACTTDACDPMTGTVTHAPIAGCGSPWKALPTAGAPSPRYLHSAVWTGSKMIVWGGIVGGSPPVTATGAACDPKTSTGTPIASACAPPPRHSHRAVWTGSKRIVWGGYGTSSHESTGGVYDPVTDTWSSMATAGAPPGRTEFPAAWTGKHFAVWGGLAGANVLGSGALYDPQTNGWITINATSAPTKRYGHSLVAAGGKLIVWGGNDNFDWHLDGKIFDPNAGAWSVSTSLTGAPERREMHTAVWTGSLMLIWGGWNGGSYLSSGGLFDPSVGASGTWTATSTASAPTGRADHGAVWTGDRLLVWGGCGTDACGTLFADGGIFVPSAAGGVWTPIPADAQVGARRRLSAVWTGSELIVWGGQNAAGSLNTGARYTPD